MYHNVASKRSLCITCSLAVYVLALIFAWSRASKYATGAGEARPGPDTGIHIKNLRKKAVVNAFRHAWAGYKKYAWGTDELKPVSRTSSEWLGLGTTLVDSLDTMYLMGLKDEFAEAKQWVAEKLQLNQSRFVNLFDVTIRILGGLLSTYHLTGDRLFLEKATDLGNRILPCFSAPSSVPFPEVNLATGQVAAPTSGCTFISEVGSLQLEFRDLSLSTGDPKYWQAVEAAMQALQSHLQDGLAPKLVTQATGNFVFSTYSIGAGVDSYYEYLLKQYLQTGKKEKKFLKWYMVAMEQVAMELVGHSVPSNMAFLGVKNGTTFIPYMEHVTCFLPAVLALGYMHGGLRTHLSLAQDLVSTCYQLYRHTASGLAPEAVYFNHRSRNGADFEIKDVGVDMQNFLRPEAVESMFVLYQVTGDSRYQEWAWDIFQAFEKAAFIPSGGYSSVLDVRVHGHPTHKDRMESFYLSETLKYLFLLFSDNTPLPLDKWVFNTQAHPLPITPLVMQ